MRIKSRPTVDDGYLARCARMEREKSLEIAQSKRLYELRRQVGAKRGEGRVGAKSRYAVMNAVRTMGKEVLTEAGQGFWDDMQRRYHWQAEDGNWNDGSSANGHVCRLGKVSERFFRGRWWHWDAAAGGWAEGKRGGAVARRKGGGNVA